jgi:RNA polymerase sigma-70 factor (ECF subfamily)
MSDSDHNLMRRCRDGDATAFDCLVARWWGPVQRILGRLAGGPTAAGGPDVDDLSQEVFLRVLAYRHSYAARATFATWLYRIALNVTRDAARRRTARRKLLDHTPREVAVESPLEAASRDEVRRQVSAALAGLPAKLREPLVLRHFGGLTFAEVADVLGEPVGTVRSRVALGLVRLREDLERHGVRAEDIPT